MEPTIFRAPLHEGDRQVELTSPEGLHVGRAQQDSQVGVVEQTAAGCFDPAVDENHVVRFDLRALLVGSDRDARRSARHLRQRATQLDQPGEPPVREHGGHWCTSRPGSLT